MEVAKLAAPPNLEVRFVSCNESAIKRSLSSELEETVFSSTHELLMSKHHTVTLSILVRRAKRAPHWGVQSRFHMIYKGMSVVCQINCVGRITWPTRMLKVIFGW